ncbi:MAG: hypothetical protein GXY36_01625 [Chloroflexi bacterium]|nr:hypothetical protein [Chloroflexota bacterium]
MGVLTTALANLAAVPVSGVTSYAPGAAPETLSSAQLPALIILPELGGPAPGLEPNGFSAGEGVVNVRVAHVLFVGPVAGGLGLRGAIPALAAAADAYLGALAADPTLGGALPIALRCTVQAGVRAYGGVDYHAMTFVHTWTLHL